LYYKNESTKKTYTISSLSQSNRRACQNIISYNKSINAKKMEKTYKITIQYYPEKDNAPEEIELKTDRLEWSIDQYQRNRMPFKVLSVEEK